VITTCAVGIGTTGTVVLDHGPGQGRRALTLVPDVHICVVQADQIVADVPDAIALRVEGVHGPRTLHVVVIDGAVPG